MRTDATLILDRVSWIDQAKYTDIILILGKGPGCDNLICGKVHRNYIDPMQRAGERHFDPKQPGRITL